jgi:hypothetical protein
MALRERLARPANWTSYPVNPVRLRTRQPNTDGSAGAGLTGARLAWRLSAARAYRRPASLADGPFRWSRHSSTADAGRRCRRGTPPNQRSTILPAAMCRRTRGSRGSVCQIGLCAESADPTPPYMVCDMFAVMKDWLVPVDDVAPYLVAAGHDLAPRSAEITPFQEPEMLFPAGRHITRPANLTLTLFRPDDDAPRVSPDRLSNPDQNYLPEIRREGDHDWLTTDEASKHCEIERRPLRRPARLPFRGPSGLNQATVFTFRQTLPARSRRSMSRRSGFPSRRIHGPLARSRTSCI